MIAETRPRMLRDRHPGKRCEMNIFGHALRFTAVGLLGAVMGSVWNAIDPNVNPQAWLAVLFAAVASFLWFAFQDRTGE